MHKKIIFYSSISENHEFIGYFINEKMEYVLVFHKVKLIQINFVNSLRKKFLKNLLIIPPVFYWNVNFSFKKCYLTYF